MTPTATPHDEAKRLSALRRYEILDTPPEREFDDVTRLAAHICGTPVALISLVDAGRQWFKSHHGTDVAETPRELAFCAHALDAPDILEVMNALEDERFRNNPLVVADPNIRFYAGSPLVTPDGCNLGTLCVIDKIPKQLAPAQREALTALSRLVVRQFELRLSERREQRLNEALSRKAAFQQAVLESADAAIISVNSEGLVTSFNRAAENLLGYAAQEVIGKVTPELFHDAEEVRARARELGLELGRHVAADIEVFLAKPRSGPPETREWTYVAKDGSRIPVMLSVASMRDEKKAIIGFLGVARDISARKTAESALQASEARLREMNENLERMVFERTGALRESEERFGMLVSGVQDYAIVLLDFRGHVVSWNPGAERIKGYAEREIVGHHLSEFYSPEDRASGRARNALDTAAAEGRYEDESWLVRRDGGRFLAHVVITALRAESGKVRGFANITRDVTERRKAELALAESESRFRQLAEQSNDVFWFVGVRPERMLYLSPAMEKIWGISVEHLYREPRAWMDAIHPEDQKNVTDAFDAIVTGRAARFEVEYRVVRPDGSVRWIMDSGTPMLDSSGTVVRVGGIAKDVTEARLNAAQRLRTQRLESIGTLAGGIAHDLNNALAPLLMGLELLRMQSPSSSDLLDTMDASARHGAGMVRQLLTFAKGIDGARTSIKPQHLMHEMVSLIHGTFPKNIHLEVRTVGELSPIRGDATQLHQVLLNLCVNARDAMPRGGTLTLESTMVELDATYACSMSAEPGRYLVWRVKDTGIGIPPDILDRIFEPFFTTKQPDKGTGLGLSTAMGIVKSHGGFLRVQSTLGSGTEFTVHLPAGGVSAADGLPSAQARSQFRGKGETILVVDDVAMVRHVASAVLASLDFKVLTAADGTDALVLVAEKRNELRCIITDFHMPNLDGLGFVRVLKHMAPNASIIVSSGQLGERDAQEFRSLGVSALLAKPYSQDTLLSALQTVFAATD